MARWIRTLVALLRSTMLKNPQITSVTPNPATASPIAQTLVVRGKNFQSKLTCSLGKASSITATSFTWTVALAVPGPITLRVTNANGRVSAAYIQYVNAPLVIDPVPSPDPVPTPLPAPDPVPPPPPPPPPPDPVPPPPDPIPVPPPPPPDPTPDPTPTPTGNTITVGIGQDLQKAINDAVYGDTILLQAGGVWTGPYILPYKAGSGYITITTTGTIPPVSDMNAATGRAAFLPVAAAFPIIRSVDSQAAIVGAFAAHHYRFLAVAVRSDYAQQINTCYGLVVFGQDGLGDASATTLSDLPNNLIFDRCYIHGNATGNLRRGIAMNTGAISVINSYISDVHEIGADTQALASWNGAGPFTVTNNYLEAAGENILFGGADPSIANLVPSDISITKNKFFKPLSWRVGDPTYAGNHWGVKNLLELKNAQRVTIDGNDFENSWLDGQVGYAILFTPRNQSGTAPWSVVQDVTLTNNIIKHVGSGVQMLGYDDGDGHPWTSLPLDHITIDNNLWYDINTRMGENGWFFVINLGSKHLTITRNTIGDHSGGALAVFDGLVSGVAVPNTNFVYDNNFAPHGDYGFFASGGAIGDLAMSNFLPAPTFLNNVLAGGAAYAASYSPTTLFPTQAAFLASFVNPASGNYRLVTGSPYRTAGTGGSMIGCDQDLIEAAL